MRTEILLLLLFIGCATRDLTPDALNKYVLNPDNGLIRQAEINSYKIVVYNKPTDLWVQQEIEGEAISPLKIDSLQKKYDQYYYFILDLSLNDKEALRVNGEMEQFSTMVQTLSFRMNNYVSMTTAAKDTIPVADFILNRTYGLSHATSLLFIFDRKRSNGAEWVQFNLNEFGLGVGDQRFRFSTEDLKNVPRIEFNRLLKK